MNSKFDISVSSASKSAIVKQKEMSKLSIIKTPANKKQIHFSLFMEAT